MRRKCAGFIIVYGDLNASAIKLEFEYGKYLNYYHSYCTNHFTRPANLMFLKTEFVENSYLKLSQPHIFGLVKSGLNIISIFNGLGFSVKVTKVFL